MSRADIDSWTPAAMALTAIRDTGRPVRQDTMEADALAAFVRKYWTPSGTLPGLQVTEKQLPLCVADELESLVRAIRALHNDTLFPTLEPSLVSELEQRAVWLTGRISKACELVLDDDVHEPADDAMIALRDRAEDATRASRIEYMFGLHAVAKQVADRLASISDFELAWLDELHDCATKLSAEGQAQTGRVPDPKVDLRNRMLTLLAQRVSKVRRAAQYVFSDHPEVLRQSVSAYDRKRRLEAKRRKQRASN